MAKRHRIGRRVSKRIFRKTALKTKKINISRPVRGGFSL